MLKGKLIDNEFDVVATSFCENLDFKEVSQAIDEVLIFTIFFGIS